MDDFLSQQASLDPAGLYRSPDGGLSLIPTGPYGPSEPEGNDELGLLSSSNPSHPLRHLDIREPQEEYSSLRDPHHVYMYPPLFTAGAFHTEPYQRASSSYAFDNGSLTESLREQRVGQGTSVLGIRPQREWHRARHIQSHQGSWGGNTPSGKPTYPAQVSGSYFDPGHGPTTPLVQQKPPVALNHDAEMRKDSKPSCPVCGKKLHAMKAVNRHWDDRHSIPQKCPYLDCNGMLTGQRKLKGHLYRHHNGVSPS